MRVGAQDPPWKVIRAFEQPNGGALVHLHNVSGGILAGDRLSLHIDVGAGAIAQVTSTSATRLYRHRAGAPDSEQHLSISVAEGAVLEYLPDAIIPFAGSAGLTPGIYSEDLCRQAVKSFRCAVNYWGCQKRETETCGRLSRYRGFASRCHTDTPASRDGNIVAKPAKSGGCAAPMATRR
jgi:hypothetical protein